MKTINGRPVPEDLSVEALAKHMESENMQTVVLACEALRMANTQRVVKLYRTSKNDSDRIALGSVLYGFCNEENHQQLFDLLKDHPKPQVRIWACRIAKARGRGDLLEQFAHDRDAHIRRLASRE